MFGMGYEGDFWGASNVLSLGLDTARLMCSPCKKLLRFLCVCVCVHVMFQRIKYIKVFQVLAVLKTHTLNFIVSM